MPNKTCSRCLETKDISEFFPLYGKQRELGEHTGRTHRPNCKKCNGKAGALYKRQNPEARSRYVATRRKSAILKKYGLTEAQYFAKLAAQGGGCDICGTTEARKLTKISKTRFQFTVDHDHATGAVRGLLCSNCNSGIGLLNDNIERLEAAIAYLLKHKPKPVVT